MLQSQSTTEHFKMYEEYKFSYALTLAVLSFCGTMSAGVALLWTLAECYIWPEERRLQINIRQHRRQDNIPHAAAPAALTETPI